MKKIYKVIGILCLLLMSSFLSAQQNNIWSTFDETKIGISHHQRKIQPKKYRTFRLDYEGLRNDLDLGSLKGSAKKEPSTQIYFPDQTGELILYEVTEAPVMHPLLAEKYPENRSYRGYALSDPSKRIRFSVTELGLSAIILDIETGQTLIETMGQDLGYYKVYSQKEIQGYEGFECFTENESKDPVTYRKAAKNADDGYLKTYRLALSANGEYSQFHLNDQNITGGNENNKKAAVMAALTTAVTRINAVLERDLAVSLQLVAKNDALIFLTPSDDPFDNSYVNPDVMLGQNQKTTDNIIGVSNYDIGHVLSTTGGVAKIRSVCEEGIKAQGVSGSFEPIGNNFYFDVLGHEIGHQLGANHTFNGYEDICGRPEQRVDATAVEPGSGSSIMAYAGYCGSQNVQSNSDAYFHAISLEEINGFIRAGGGATCAGQSILTNNQNAPVVAAGPDLILPVGTPFKLRGEATDADLDPITFGWEQIDAGITAVPPSGTATNGALFRSRVPSLDPVRYFPSLKSLRNGALNSKWEVIPQVARELNFRLTARDNDLNGGQVSSDDVRLTITDRAGPFKLISQNKENEEWLPGGRELVEWDVAGTDANGVNVKAVNILLSIDGGFTYPIVLASNVNNDGSQEVSVPDLQSPYCFVMVEAVGNAFFAVNSNKFSIGAYESICTTYESKDIPKDVIFGRSNNAISSNEVLGDDEIESITVSVKIKHPFIRDLALSLESPEGTVIELLKNPCDFNDEDIDVVFSDTGEQIFCASFSPTISGNYQALSVLSELNGESAKGQWKLTVADEGPGDDGLLESWSMNICTAKAVLSISENDLDLFQVYPNPSEGLINVVFSSQEDGDVVISIHDLLGRELLQEMYKEPSGEFAETIDLGKLTSGMYLLKVRKGQKISYRKLKMR